MARPTVRILTRYLLRQHLAPFGFALGALTAFLLIQQIARQLGNLVGKGLPGTVIADVFVLSLPFIVATTLPMAVLVAVLYAFTRLAADHEITAMKASGVSVGQLLGPVIAGAAVVGALAFFWNDQVLPRANHSLRLLLVDIQRKKPSFYLKEQVINEVVPGRFFLRAARIDAVNNALADVTLYDLEDVDRRRIISAAVGHMAYTPDGRDLFLTLFDGNTRQVNRTDPTQFNRTFFRTNRIRVEGVGNKLQRTETDPYRSDREMGVCEMRQVVRDAHAEFAQANEEGHLAVENDLRRLAGIVPLAAVSAPPPDSRPIGLYCRLLHLLPSLGPRAAGAQTPTRSRAPPTRPLPPLVTPGATESAAVHLQAAEDRAARFEIEIQKKYALSVACLVFALLGIPIAIRFPRGGIGLVIGVSLVVFTIYYVGLIGGEELGNRRVVSPFFAMWTANVLFSGVGLVGLALARRPGQSISGGDWADLRASLLGWLPWGQR
ncbi:MAG TPA: LptF/LptG family permease [Gemmatimonadales bacterium]|nr:LptF/LptG family permease [Gemmatimonadales bacterium]